MNSAVRGALIGALIFACSRSATPDSSKPSARVVHFSWTPPGAPVAAYEMDQPEDQHRLVMVGNVAPGGRYPVVVALHGQPRRGESPRNYAFGKMVLEAA